MPREPGWAPPPLEPGEPQAHLGVMVSSTFSDLVPHRAALIDVIIRQGMYPVAMEHDAALPAETVVDASLRKVRDAAAYVGVIGHSYGQIPDTDLNPDRLSLTELEFREARRLHRPILIFLMGDEHPVTVAHVERDPEKMPKLIALRDEVKRVAEQSAVHRVYRVFTDLHDFEVAAIQSVAELRRHLDRQQADDIPVSTRQRSAYLRQVASYAPPNLVGRDAELAELAAFCSAPAQDEPRTDRDARDASGVAQYQWWRAPAWSGKSALMATFVLQPPEQMDGRVRIVSFFVTARFAGQDTRAAFVTALLPQLSDLVGQDPPATADEADRDAQLLEFLDRAAVVCRHAGQRLVLVVDGLDEDRSITTGSRARSIAGLLPAQPPAGMRIIVAGRPNPPIPDDVEPWHPLRDPRIIRPLPPSDIAEGVKKRAGNELRDLLTGSTVEQNLLGLITAARGGLSCSDLHELMDAPLWEIEDSLHTASGRTFTRRVNVWRHETGTEVYLLGHEELQAASCRYLGERRLAGYRDRLHLWSLRYRERGWPPSSPEYLLSGYFGMLATTGDLKRIVGCALDTPRHDRMLDITGGDAAALAEVRAALDLVIGHDPADLGTALRLIHRRDALTGRNSNIPVSLPAVWATLGDVDRAHALATSLVDLADQARALSAAAAESAAAGRAGHALKLAAAASTTALSIPDASRQAPVLAAASRAAAMAGDTDKALVAARSITDPFPRATALKEAAEKLATAGRTTAATTLAHAITDPSQQATALAAVASALATTGHADDATMVARSITDPFTQAYTLQKAAEELAAAGRTTAATTLAHAITDPSRQATALGAVASALAAAGRADDAITIARALTQPRLWIPALVKVVEALVAAGRGDEAATLAGETEGVARSMTNRHDKVHALPRVVRALVAVGRAADAAALADEAATLARSMGYPLFEAAEALAVAGRVDAAASLAHAMGIEHRPASVLAAVVEASATAGHLASATMLAHLTANRYDQESALGAAARTLARTGRTDDAAALVSSIRDPYRRDSVLSQVVRELAKTGHVAAAAALGRLIGSFRQELTLSAAARTSVAAGDVDGAATLARCIVDVHKQVPVLATVVEALSAVGRGEDAAALAGETELLARSVPEPHLRAPAVAVVVRTLAAVGRVDDAIRVARSIGEPRQQASALADVAQVSATGGAVERAAALAAEAESHARSAPDPYRWASALAMVAEAMSTAGDSDHAATLAREAETHARSVLSPYWQVDALASVSRAWATAGCPGQAVAVAVDAEARIPTIADSLIRTFAVAEVADALAVAGRADDAVRTIRSVSGTHWGARVTARVARTMARSGRTEHVVTLVAEIESAVRAHDNAVHRASALATAAEALAIIGHTEHATAAAATAETYARAIEHASSRGAPLALVATAWALVGRTDHAVALAAEALHLTLSITTTGLRSLELVDVAEAFLQAGRTDRAITTARLISDPDKQAAVLSSIVDVLVDSGETERAVDLAVVASRACRWHTIAGLFLRVDPSVADVVLELGLIGGQVQSKSIA